MCVCVCVVIYSNIYAFRLSQCSEKCKRVQLSNHRRLNRSHGYGLCRIWKVSRHSNCLQHHCYMVAHKLRMMCVEIVSRLIKTPLFPPVIIQLEFLPFFFFIQKLFLFCHFFLILYFYILLPLKLRFLYLSISIFILFSYFFFPILILFSYFYFIFLFFIFQIDVIESSVNNYFKGKCFNLGKIIINWVFTDWRYDGHPSRVVTALDDA